MSEINFVDICCGLNWGDEAKGKVVAQLAKSGNYNFVCRWAGGNNAGHTIYIDGKKYKSHLVPSGVFFNVPSIIGPDCVVNLDSFKREIAYLKENGFNTDLIKVSPKAHLITDEHIEEDKVKYKKQGTTSKGIAPCYRDKYARKGILIGNVDFFKTYLWDEKLHGNILCEGAQGFWLDVTHGNYPYVTSSTTLPYGACSLGFSPKLIRNIYGASKIYDTRVGFDPLFPETLLLDKDLVSIIKQGKEYGTTTGRVRKVNWLNLDKLIDSINISGTNIIIVSKTDVLDTLKLFKVIHNDNIKTFDSMQEMTSYITSTLTQSCHFLEKIHFSDHLEVVNGLI